MSLLSVLGLPAKTGSAPADTAATVGGAARLGATVTLVNASGSDLRLLRAGLQFNTARFVPPVPASIPARGRVTFRVEESTVGAIKTAGSARFHLEQHRHTIDVTFLWARATGSVKIEGTGPFSQSVDAVEDSETGNEYKLFFKDVEQFGEDPLQLRVDLTNASKFGMTLVSVTLDDPANTEFEEKPPAHIDDKLTETFAVQALADDHPDAAGNMLYRIDQPGAVHLARMRWRKGAQPLGSIEPNDGSFIVESKLLKDRITFKVLAHTGPAPLPPGPVKVTVVNQTGFAMTRDLLDLNGKTARFKSEPVETLDSGRKTTFEVESTDPESSETDGIVTYVLHSNPNGEEGKREPFVNLSWRSQGGSFAKVVPPQDDITVAISGTDDNRTFVVDGPALDFVPPPKIKQPTLREGDSSPDGWVEYLQEALNHHLHAGLVADGIFGPKTTKSVKDFQKSHKKEGVLVDGIVGDETWSFLREGAPEKPHTDGRKPHTFVEKGNEARWVMEADVCRFDAPTDALVMVAISVGDVDKIKDRLVRIRVVNPDGVQKIFSRPIGPGIQSSTTGEGFQHVITVNRFSTLFDETATAGPPAGSYQVDAFFDQELGGDSFSQAVVIAGK